MFEYIKIMEKRLSEEDAAELKSIYEPKIVAVPPGNARRQFAVMPDGEIRSYDDKAQYYIYSTDCGLSFKKKTENRGVSVRQRMFRESHGMSAFVKNMLFTAILDLTETPLK